MRFGFAIDKLPKGFQEPFRLLITAVIALAALSVIAYALISSASLALRIVLVLVALVLSGQAIAYVNQIRNASYGLYLLGGKKGIGFVDSLSRRSPRFWNAMADWGLVLGFGVLSLFIFKKRIGLRTFIFGLISLFVIAVFVYPYLSIIFSFVMVNISQVTAAPVSGTPAAAQANLLYLGFIALTMLGGFSLSTIISLIAKAGLDLLSAVQFFQCMQASLPNCVNATLTPQSSGVLPVIPGITIPLAAGVISLTVILVTHELSHGVLARISKIKIKSIGIALFGIIPIGAFVEPDEKKVAKLKVKEQDRISIAGISANMITSLLFFVVTFAMLYYVLPNISTMGVIVTALAPNTPAYNVIPQNSVITAWNGNPIRNQYDLSNTEALYVTGNFVNVTTSTGTYRLMPTPEGKLGIGVGPAVGNAPIPEREFHIRRRCADIHPELLRRNLQHASSAGP